MDISENQRFKAELFNLLVAMHYMRFNIYDLVQAFDGIKEDEIDAVAHFFARLINNQEIYKPQALRCRRSMARQLSKITRQK